MKCLNCEDCGWVCENHESVPWEGPNACKCGGAGMPCFECNPCDAETPPRPLTGSTIIFDKNGWRH